MLHGEVFSFETGMLGSTYIDLWVAPGVLGEAGWWNFGPLHADELGLFERDVPLSSVSVFASRYEFVQPCAVLRFVDRDTEIRLEMLPTSAFLSTDPPRPQLSTERSVTGTVSEDTPAGRQIVTGAYVWIDDGAEIRFADTNSDLAGHYYLCDAPNGAFIHATKDGFETTSLGPIDSQQPIVLDIVLDREES